jgi:hypothetical protein
MIAAAKGLWRFHRKLPGFLSTPLSPAECQAMIEASIRDREANLVAMLRRGVFGNPASPYLPLLKRSGATLADIEALVRSDGVDATLTKLAGEGVQVSLDEFKGRVAVRRPGLKYAVSSADFDNPLIDGGFEAMTGGSTGRRQRLTIELDLLLFEAATRQLLLSAHGLSDMPVAIWRAVPPGTAGLKHALRSAKLGRPLVAWFTPVEQSWDRLRWRSTVFLHVALWHGRRAGGVIPAPRYVALSEPGPVAQWLARQVAEGRPGLLSCPVSAAVRVVEHCKDLNLDIAGSVFWVGGEPISRVRVEIIEAAGARTVNGYAISEAGSMGVGCADRVEKDEIHFIDSKVAVLPQPGSLNAGTGASRLLLTSLLPSSPKVLLNVDSGDYGVLNRRRCGCPVEQAGFHQHLHTIRSFDKLNAGGMHFTASDALELVERVLPEKFNGRPGQFQLVEEEHEGKSRVAILVSPSVSIGDEGRVIDTALRFLGSRSPGHKMMSVNWRQSGIMEVRREEPAVSSVGKIQPLRVKARA